MQNWGGNVDYGDRRILAPKTLEGLAEAIQENQVRPIGTMHSFSDVALGDGLLLSAAGLPFEPELNFADSSVTVSASTRFGELALFLEENGLALKNMGSLPHISLAGAYATGTHGSGDTNQMLSSSLKAFSFIDAKGELIHYGIGDENFDACRLGLGSYGLWVSVTLHVVPTYQIRQDVYRQIPWESFYEDPKLGTSAGYSVSLFTKWGGAKIDQLWAKSMIGDLQPPATLYGQSAEGNSLVELAPGVGANLTQQGGVPGPWLDRLPHFRLDATPSAGNEIQTEYFLNRDAAIEAMREINKISSLINPTLVISEIRTIAQDSAWLSPMKQEDKIALHFTWKNERQSVSKAVDLVERALAPFAPIPHWGKVHHFDERRLALRHEKLSEARATFDSLDPAGKFSSEYLRILGVRS